MDYISNIVNNATTLPELDKIVNRLIDEYDCFQDNEVELFSKYDDETKGYKNKTADLVEVRRRILKRGIGKKREDYDKYSWIIRAENAVAIDALKCENLELRLKNDNLLHLLAVYKEVLDEIHLISDKSSIV